MAEPVRVLIADKMDPRAAAIFRQRGIDVDENPGLWAEELNAVIGGYDGVAGRRFLDLEGRGRVSPKQIGVSKCVGAVFKWHVRA